MCSIAAAATDRSLAVVSSVDSTEATGLAERLTSARDVLAPGQLLLVATDSKSAALAQSLGVAWYRPASRARAGGGGGGGGGQGATEAVAAQWRVASLLLRAGCVVVVSTSRVRWAASPFPHLSRDVDVEAAQASASSSSRGSVVGVHDPPMGWSAYGQTMTCPLLDPSVVALQPTHASAELAAQLASRVDGSGSIRVSHGGGGLSMLLTRLVHQPAHDGETRAGVTMRALRHSCFAAEQQGSVWSRLGVQGVVSTLAPSNAASNEEHGLGGGRGVAMPPSMGGNPNDILTSAAFEEARASVLTHGCKVQPRDEGAATPRPLNDILKPSDAFPHPAACAADENMAALCELLRVAAVNREVLAAVSNKNIFAMLGTFLVGCARANITNAVVVALDDPTAEFARKKGAHTYVRKLVARGGSTDNHATSGLKFAVLFEFLSAGCSVLLSDVDVLWMQNPFTLPSLYRDADVEGMTDGWDDATAYGYHWQAHRALRLSARNSGLFYARATVETRRMMERLKGRMQREAVWDQTAYNEEMWWATLPGEAAFGVSARVMNYFCNLNSKVLFRFMLNDEEMMARHRPVSIHVNCALKLTTPPRIYSTATLCRAF